MSKVKAGSRSKNAAHKRAKAKAIAVGQYLVSDPEVYHGELTFR